MAPRRRRATPVPRPRRPRSQARNRSAAAGPQFAISPAVLRSIAGLILLVVGLVSGIALLLPGGNLTDWWRDVTVPFFGAARFLFPVVLLLAGWYIEWGPGREPGAPWGRTLLGIALSYVSFLGAIQLTAIRGEFTGGRIGRFLEGLLVENVTRPGAFVLLAAGTVAGLVIAFDVPLRTLLAPLLRAIRLAGGTLLDRTERAPEPEPAVPLRAPAAVAEPARRRGVRAARGAATVPGQVGVWGPDDPAPLDPEPEPAPLPPPVAPPPAPPARPPVEAAPRVAPGEDDDGREAGGELATRDGTEWRLPPLDLLEDAAAGPRPGPGEAERHAWAERTITDKLRQLGIEAQVTGRNAGPVVTQYEVQPAPNVKLSRIEALSDDLAMALAARSIRIEAPIPGKSAVGIEIPNREPNVVALRRILEERAPETGDASLPFALGRDVAGAAVVVDLARMPHLLIAGATGSGKSVMVNALITSLLCRKRPSEVRMVLMDLKRVELTSYNELPHLYVPVITEPEKAKAALKWAVNEMEHRYRRFAGAGARNIRAFNEGRAEPDDRLPYIVLVIDELADLMMREGKNVEDPIVRLAQKARATGIHMVLATQRPSVNVVTGLIKANFPSRIAFAMASQIDSRTILDAPGAEDLIGRGDMLYQPSDQPRPARHQGVFVSDAEITRVTEHWKGQTDGPQYDLSILVSDEESTGRVEELEDGAVDAKFDEAVAVIREYDRASASLLQRRLRIGYARAARIIDQLEARGHVGPFDGSAARVVIRRDDEPGVPAEEDEE